MILILEITFHEYYFLIFATLRDLLVARFRCNNTLWLLGVYTYVSRKKNGKWNGESVNKRGQKI